MSKVITAKNVKTSEQTNTGMCSEPLASTLKEAPDVTLLNEESLKKLKLTIRQELGKSRKSFLNTAFALYEVYNSKLFKLEGCRNIYDFAEKNFSLPRSLTSCYINICKKFGEVS